jgi:Holliday junction DNA helicase RuvA
LYDFLRGQLVESLPGRLVLDVGGIGFDVITTDQNQDNLGSKGKEVLLWTHLHFKEDSLTLYGFSQRRERELFRLLIKVSGVGPRLALQILSGIRPEELVRAMADEDWKRLTLISGIGPKTARRLLIELKEKLTDQELQFSPSGPTPKDPILVQAYNALVNLGFPSENVRMAMRDLPTSDGLEEIVKKALAKLAS